MTRISTIPLHELPSSLQSFPQKWPFPRGDLYHWIPVLDRFDEILEEFIKEYKLHDGPQTISFGRRLLLKKTEQGAASALSAPSEDELDNLGFGDEGDRELAESILRFSRLLMDSCGNRSLYSSSDRLGDLLNTTSLSLLITALHLAFRLAIRYHYSRARSALPHTLNSHLLSSHYSINLDRVQKIADPFVKGTHGTNSQQPTSATSTHSKGKEKASSGQKARRNSLHNNDLSNFIREDASDALSDAYTDFADIAFQYYHHPPAADQSGKAVPLSDSSNAMPPTPTPVRRASGLSRSHKVNGDDATSPTESADAAESQSVASQAPQASGYRTIHIPGITLKTLALEQILVAHLPEIPKVSHYDFLHRLRVAKGIAESRSSRLQIVELRMLAITNLAYIYPESMLQQKLLQQDSDEPRRLQIVQQLAEMVRPVSKTKTSLPLTLRTIAVGALEALSKHKSRFGDVCAALQVNVNHGVIFHILQEAVDDLASENSEDGDLSKEEWREALLSLLDSLPATGSTSRTAETLIGAGLFDILVKVLELRTEKAERIHSRILMFIMTITHGARDSLQTFANSKGFDVVADLVAYEVTSSLEHVEAGKGLAENYKSQVMDYQMPFFQQQTLRWLFKFINSMLSQQSGNVDRLIRNLIDSPQLLTGLRKVIENAKVFGSNIWSGAINIMSSFIHNEPTSYAVIVEAGLSKALLEAVTLNSLTGAKDDSNKIARAHEAKKVLKTDSQDSVVVHKQTLTDLGAEPGEAITLSRPVEAKLAQGILPANDTIVQIPQAFGAMCLNTAGQELFLSSDVLDVYFEIFESPDHVKSLSSDTNTAKMLGGTFDELVRHHPRLKHTVIRTIVLMMARVNHLCRKRAKESNEGANLWVEDPHGNLISNEHALDTDDVEMTAPSPTRSAAGPETHNVTVTDYVSAVSSFLVGFCENQSSCVSLIQAGVLEFLLDLATLPSLPYDFNNRQESHDLARVVHTLMEHKPHLVLPAVIVRTQTVLSKLDQFTSFESQKTFFSRYLNSTYKGKAIQESALVDGTSVLKALVEVHTLCAILQECFSHPILATPRSHHTLFSQVNLADYYCPLVKELGKLHSTCLWEEILLQRILPESLKHSTKINGLAFGTDEADQILGLIDDNGITSSNGISISRRQSRASKSSGSRRPSTTHADESGLMLKNAPALRYLLSQIPLTITPFFQGLGRSLVPKRRLDPYLRQNAYKVSESIADAAVGELKYSAISTASAKDRFAYLIVVLTSISQLVVEGHGDRPHSQCLTLILQSFKKQGGLAVMNDLLQMFFIEVSQEPGSQERGLLSCALGGMKIILAFYGQITSPKHIVDCSQSQALHTSERERDREHPYYFSPNQFLVDLRVLVLSAVKTIWDSTIAETSSVAVVKCLVDMLRTILEADHENGALKRSDPAPVRARPEVKTLTPMLDRQATLQARGVPADIAGEALFRCFNNRETSEEYCDAHLCRLNMPRMPIPAYEQYKRESNAPSPSPEAQREHSAETLPEAEQDGSQDESSVTSEESEHANGETGTENVAEETGSTGVDARPETPTMELRWTGAQEVDDENGMAMSIDNLLNLSEEGAQPPASNLQDQTVAGPEAQAPQRTTSEEKFTIEHFSTLDELNDLRSAIRDTLIDQVLEILSAHEGITFDLADLITTAASKAPEAMTMRKDIGVTLVQSLISFQMDDDFRPNGRKVASYANLLAIILQQKEFYEASLEELKDNFASLVTFVQVFTEPENGEPSSPWVAQILLVLEKLLAEDVQPQQIKWSPPAPDASVPIGDWKETVLEIEQPNIDSEDKSKLFEAVMGILPRVGKDESLALSVVRILVILSRNRTIADSLGEKHNLQRLFVMVKQLAGLSDERFQKTFLLILRHVVEDDDIIRDVIRSEIDNFFKPTRPRQHDTVAYARHMAHLIIRSPSLFLEISNEKLKLEHYEQSSRPQVIVLKEERTTSTQDNDAADKPTQPETSKEGQSNPDQTNEGELPEEKTKSSENRVPTIERPDGVIHYLLSQLLQYRDVEDKEPEDVAQDATKENESKTDNAMPSTSNGTGSSNGRDTPKPASQKKADKAEYQAKQHPIYNYRCFLLQCLTELLMSYSSAKIEFINFSSKADPKVMTPSKPRAGILNYLLTRLIPCGTLDRPESISSKKKLGQSNWAMCAVVGLCLKPNYKASPLKDEDGVEESDSDLLFVRKFVLENALKAFKDASALEEALDVKYGRLLSLADLFTRLLVGRIVPNIPVYANEILSNTQKEVAKIMFEKNYISTLTNAIADVDLNFPNSRRVVKYILRPLKTLTDTAIELSQNSDISTTPGQTDDDSISAASSASEMEVEREETPDLFRNSTLGILEPGREEELSSESSVDEDEDMYDDEYGDEMEYEEEMERDGDEVVSDEDEELDDAGPVEGLPGDSAMDVEVIIDGDEDQSEDGEDSEEDDDDDMDEGDEVEILDEINGDDENDSLDGPEDEWQDEDEDDDRDEDEPLEDSELGQMNEDDDEGIANNVPNAHGSGAIGDLVLDLEGGPPGGGIGPPPGVFDLGMDGDNGGLADALRDINAMRDDGGMLDEEDGEDDEDVEDEDVAFEADYDGRFGFF